MKNLMIVWVISCAVLLSILNENIAFAQESQPTQRNTDPITESDTAFQYRLFKTSNLWTFILLDTVYGRAWQVQYSTGESFAGKLLINGQRLLPEGASPQNGRFTLYSTDNLYTFLLLDREDGRIWQLQWSMKDEYRGIMRALQ